MYNISNSTRKFNTQFEMTSINYYNDYNLMKDEIVHKNGKNVTKDQFTFIKPDLSKIKGKYKIDCIITHIKSKTEQLFYVNIYENSDYKKCVKYLHNYKEMSPQPLDHYPEEGELFGIIIENYMYRAVRENDEFRKSHTTFSELFNVYLIDTGEIFNVTKEMQLYYLPYECKILRSQAVLCKLIMVDLDTDIDLEKYLCDNIYMKNKMDILQEIDSILYVSLIDGTNPFTNYLSRIPNKKNLSVENNMDNLFYNNFKYYSLTPINEDQQHHFFCNTNSYNDINEKLNLGKLDNPLFNDNSKCTKSSSSSSTLENNENCIGNSIIDTTKILNISDKSQLSETELAILAEEPLNTTNALKAVLGYVPKDDKRICRFYDPETKSCFKGSRCKFEHVQKLEDGWTRDEAEVVIDIKSKLILPSVGNMISLCPTYLINLESFYAHYSIKSSEISNLIMKMNSLEIKSKYVPLDCLPAPFQLVITMHKDSMWYRARIMEIIDDFTFKIFYLDFGDTDIVGIDNIRKWESRFDYLPFQAIKCQMAGIEAKKEHNLIRSGIEELKKMILNRSLEAKVINIFDDELLIQLYDENGYNIGERLTSMGYSNKKITKFVSSTNVLLPG